MDIKQDVILAPYTTMKIGGSARYFVDITSEDELVEALKWAKDKKIRHHVLGGGSNTIFTDEGFAGLVLHMKIGGLDIKVANDSSALLSAGAGEQWDAAVAMSTELGYSGIEALSLIPGTVGAAPVQNIGAYGQELKDTFVELRALNIDTMEIETLSNEDMLFAYRDSLLKQRDNYIVTAITLDLNRAWLKPPFYEALQKYIDDEGIQTFDPQTIRDAVIAIRSSKLPDPQTIPNSGSFFVNPVVENSVIETLLVEHPNLPSWAVNDTRSKIPAGWLIEQVGLKGTCSESGNICIHQKHALVIINHGGDFAELQGFVRTIKNAVAEKFGIELIQEPQVVI